MTSKERWASLPAASLLALAAIFLAAVPAQASTTVYPRGGNGFDTSAEGWSPGATSCTPAALLCTPEASYDSEVGNPPGSIAAKTTVTANAIDLFKGIEVWNSPRFAVPIGAVTGASVRLDRAFDPGGLVDVEPKATYTVTVNDLTAGTSSKPLTEELTKEDSTFATRSAPVSIVSGHEYQMSIESVTAQSAVAASVVTGTAAARFDNVGIVVQTGSAGNGSSGGGSGSGHGSAGNGSGSSFTSSRLLALLKSGATTSPVKLKGKRLFVKVSCPRKIGRACHIRAQGMLTRRKAATAARTVKVGKGKGRRIVLRVKPKARRKLAHRRWILVRQRVRAGKARATIYQRRKLIRR